MSNLNLNELAIDNRLYGMSNRLAQLAKDFKALATLEKKEDVKPQNKMAGRNMLRMPNSRRGV